MRLMVSGATTSVERWLAQEIYRPFIGALVTPASSNSLERICGWGVPYGIDNGCYDASRFDQDSYLALLRRAMKASARPTFVTVPDQAPRRGEDNAHCHACTRFLFDEWFGVLADEGLHKLPLAFVAQNGLEDTGDVPWGRIDAVFVGGDDEFKEGDFALMDLIPEAKARGKWVHIGRVNGRARLRLARLADADSCDGSSMSRFPDVFLPRRLASAWLAEKEAADLDALNARLEADIVRLEAQRG